MRCQILFSKEIQKIFENVVCWNFYLACKVSMKAAMVLASCTSFSLPSINVWSFISLSSILFERNKGADSVITLDRVTVFLHIAYPIQILFTFHSFWRLTNRTLEKSEKVLDKNGTDATKSCDRQDKDAKQFWQGNVRCRIMVLEHNTSSHCLLHYAKFHRVILHTFWDMIMHSSI